jgi:UTP--glucose-1-phosphate uridylyltransferase
VNRIKQEKTDMQKTTWKKVRKAVFPVAGLGTRFLPATKVIPKEMLILGDKPLIQHAVEEARAAGIEEFLFVTSKGKNLMEDHFRTYHELARTLEQRGKKELLDILKSSDVPEGRMFATHQNAPLGLGHAVWCAKSFVGDEPFAVILPDDVVLGEKGCVSQMIEAYNEVGGNIVSVVDVPRADTSKYGILDVGRENGRLTEVRGLVEKPAPEKAPSTLSIIGRYILQPEIFGALSKFETGSGGEIQLTDAMAKLIGTQPFHGFRFEGERFDCGSQLGLIEATVEYALRSKQIGPQIRTLLQARLAADNLLTLLARAEDTVPEALDKAGPVPGMAMGERV